MDYRKDYSLYISFKIMGCDTRPCIQCDNCLLPIKRNGNKWTFVETCPARGRTDVTTPEDVNDYVKYFEGTYYHY